MFVILFMLEAALFLQKVEFTVSSETQGTVCPVSRGVLWINLAGNLCYFLEARKVWSWEFASNECTAKGGSLASFHSMGEVDRLRTYFAGVRHEDSPYIGLHRSGIGHLKWSDGSPVDFENWSNAISPNAANNCTTMGYYTGTWYPSLCNMSASYVCSTPKRIPCEQDTCRNGGYCTKDGINKLFPCKCKHGFVGLRCDARVLCSQGPCENGGTCKQDGVNGVFNCSCVHGYGGAKCEQRITCDERLCKNGGSCSHHPVNGVFKCQCARGYKGVTCEERDSVLTIVLISLSVVFLLIAISIALFFVVRRYRRQRAPDPKQLQSEYMKRDNDSLDSCHMNILDDDEEDNR